MAEARAVQRSDEILLDMRGISKSYPGVQALEDATFRCVEVKSTGWWERMAPANRH